MGLESTIRGAKRFLKGAALASLIYLSGCIVKEVPVGPGNGDDNGSRGNPPAAPSITETIPYPEEPQRGIQVIIRDYSDNEEGFTFERKSQGGNFASLSSFPAKSGSGDHIIYNDLGLEMSTLYTYRVRAYNQHGNSNWNEKSETSLGLQEGVIEVKTIADTYVKSAQPTTNFGNRSSIAISRGDVEFGSGPDDEEKAFLLFQLPNLPFYSRGFKSATLRIADASGGNTLYPGPLTIYVGAALDNWNEQTLNWNNKPDVIYYPSTQTATHDPRNESYVLINVSNTVSDWYSSIISNKGFGLTTTSQDRYGHYYSREGYEPGSALLEVDYT